MAVTAAVGARPGRGGDTFVGRVEVSIGGSVLTPGMFSGGQALVVAVQELADSASI
ncbi:MAG: hypothetical protein QOI01_5251 [Mycobacterium sp.]|jgi:hypothetical protein|nr:hypothetical protein [Mycobacterium sp.]